MLIFIFLFSANESSHGDTSQSECSPSRKRSKNRFLDGLKKKASVEIGEVDRYFNDVPGNLEDLNRFPTIKEIFL